MKSICEIHGSGSIIWKNENDKVHREGDMPAMIWSDGSQFWYKSGQYHRDGDKPAAIYPDGTRYWYLYGKCYKDKRL